MASIKEINKKNPTLLFWWHDQYWRRWFKLTKNWQKVTQKYWCLLHNDKPANYDDKYMKIKFNSDDNLPLNEI